MKQDVAKKLRERSRLRNLKLRANLIKLFFQIHFLIYCIWHLIFLSQVWRELVKQGRRWRKYLARNMAIITGFVYSTDCANSCGDLMVNVVTIILW